MSVYLFQLSFNAALMQKEEGETTQIIRELLGNSVFFMIWVTFPTDVYLVFY